MFILINKKDNCIDGITKDKDKLIKYFNNLENKDDFEIVELKNDDYPLYIVSGDNFKFKIMNEKESNEFFTALKETKEDLFGKELMGIKLFEKEEYVDDIDMQYQEDNFQYCILEVFKKDYLYDGKSYIEHEHISRRVLNNHFNGNTSSLV